MKLEKYEAPVKLEQYGLETIYHEADIDLVWFNELWNYLENAENYYSGEINDVEIFEEALKLARFLAQDDYFEFGINKAGDDGEVYFAPYSDGVVGFEKDARHYFETEGLEGEALTILMNIQKRIAR